MAKKLGTEKIISMFREVHGNKYDYSIVDYVGYDVKVKIICNKHGIEYTRQYAILNDNLFCKNRKILIDFFLPKHNMAIEFNGVQHYKPIKLFGGEEQFIQQQERDITLRRYCKQNKIKLIEISYLDIKNIDTILTKELRRVIK